MSRSYKKVPYCGEPKGKSKKRMANKVVRMWLKEHPDVSLKGGEFKKLYEKWDICDYCWITPWEEYWKRELRLYEYFLHMYPNRKHKEPDMKESYRHWYKYHKGK